MSTQCEVQGCESSAHEPAHQLRGKKGWTDLPLWFAVCNYHRGLLSNPETEWMLEYKGGGRQLYLGPDVGHHLRGLNEYLLLEQPTSVTGYAAGREFSHPQEDGLHIPLRVRRRGGEPQDMTLVVPPGMMAELARLLQIAAPPSASPRQGRDSRA